MERGPNPEQPPPRLTRPTDALKAYQGTLPDPSPKAEGLNPYYQAYAAAQGLSPDAVIARDEELFPGGKMTGYIRWIGAQWERWFAAAMPGVDRRNHHLSEDERRRFGLWLSASFLDRQLSQRYPIVELPPEFDLGGEA